eukprot:12938304-Alexandrium_andersonii.AAC.1
MLGAVLLIDLHAATVSRCEFRTACALSSAARCFFQLLCLGSELGNSSFAQRPWLLAVAARSDAAN